MRALRCFGIGAGVVDGIVISHARNQAVLLQLCDAGQGAPTRPQTGKLQVGTVVCIHYYSVHDQTHPHVASGTTIAELDTPPHLQATGITLSLYDRM